MRESRERAGIAIGTRKFFCEFPESNFLATDCTDVHGSGESWISWQRNVTTGNFFTDRVIRVHPRYPWQIPGSAGDNADLVVTGLQDAHRKGLGNIAQE